MTAAVGFDLDMTLIDSRQGIAATFRALTAQTGVFVDGDLAVTRLGPPLRAELAEWFPAADVEQAVTTYRSLYPKFAIGPTVPMPGAVEALAAVRELGFRVVVVTSKLGRLAELHLAHLGMNADELAGDLFAEGKAAALVELDEAATRRKIDQQLRDAGWEGDTDKTWKIEDGDIVLQTESVNTAACARFASAIVDHDTVRLLS